MLAISQIAALAALFSGCSALNILVNNDDGFGSSNIRELYRLLNAAGHNGKSCFGFCNILPLLTKASMDGCSCGR
jgi:hypothetical protein